MPPGRRASTSRAPTPRISRTRRAGQRASQITPLGCPSTRFRWRITRQSTAGSSSGSSRSFRATVAPLHRQLPAARSSCLRRGRHRAGSTSRSLQDSSISRPYRRLCGRMGRCHSRWRTAVATAGLEPQLPRCRRLRLSPPARSSNRSCSSTGASVASYSITASWPCSTSVKSRGSSLNHTHVY